MTQNEFEERIGRKVTGDEFEVANDLYMMSGELDKDRFCADYKKHKDSEIIKALYDKADAQSDRLHVLSNEREETVDMLIDMTEEYTDNTIRQKVFKMIGEREYLRRKINKGYDLWRDERQILNDILSGGTLPPVYKD